MAVAGEASESMAGGSSVRTRGSLSAERGPAIPAPSRYPSHDVHHRSAMVSARAWTQDFFVIEGGAPLSGTDPTGGEQERGAAAARGGLLTDAEIVLENVPHIRDVDAMLELIARPRRRGQWVGAEHGAGSVPRTSSRRRLDAALCRAHPRLDPARRPAARRASGASRCRRRAATSSAAAASTRTCSRSPGSAPAFEVDSRVPDLGRGRAARAPSSSSTRRRSPAPRTRSWPPWSRRARRRS